MVVARAPLALLDALRCRGVAQSAHRALQDKWLAEAVSAHSVRMVSTLAMTAALVSPALRGTMRGAAARSAAPARQEEWLFQTAATANPVLLVSLRMEMACASLARPASLPALQETSYVTDVAREHRHRQTGL
mmetsp:Transcript_50488/g.109619  ORF Transcript_50488/g.109619 Transcript_50488/m.109619 type:complete len:133 (-) Transcript_50488:1887-2285(-)